MHKTIFLAIGVMIFCFVFSGVAFSEEMKTIDQVTISGTINAQNQLTDEDGKAFNLADNEQGLKVKAMVGRRVQIKGTLKEEGGNSIVEVSEYKVLTPTPRNE